MTEEQKEKYANFLDNISEILGLNKPVDILRLCVVTDEYLRPIEKHIAELEKENAELKDDNKTMADNYSKMEQKFYDNLTQAKELLKKIEKIVYNGENEIKRLSKIVDILAEAEQFLNKE